MPKKIRTNTDLMVDLMERSPHGPLAQAFIVHAVETFAAQVATGKPADFDNAMVNGAVWHSIGCDVLRRMAAFYDRPAPILVGDKFINVEPELDSGENDEERTTPAGSVWRVNSLDGAPEFIGISCDATGAAINPTEAELANPAMFTRAA